MIQYICKTWTKYDYLTSWHTICWIGFSRCHKWWKVDRYFSYIKILKIIAMLSKSVEHIHNLNKSIIVKLNFFFRETKIHNSVWRNWIMLMVSFMPEWNHASFSLCFKPIYKFSKEFWRRNSFDNFWSIQQNLFQEVFHYYLFKNLH